MARWQSIGPGGFGPFDLARWRSDGRLTGYHARLHTDLFTTVFRTPRERREEQRAAEICRQTLQSLGLQDVADRQANLLSYGMQRRVEIGKIDADASRGAAFRGTGNVNNFDGDRQRCRGLPKQIAEAFIRRYDKRTQG